MNTELHKLLTSEEAMFEGVIDIESVLNVIDKENLNIKGTDGNFPIHEACRLPNVESAYIIIKEMIEKGADVNSRNDADTTPLHFAIAAFESHSSTKIIKLLLENGADPMLKDEKGVKPADDSSPEIVELVSSFAINRTTRSDEDSQEIIIRLAKAANEQASILMHNLEENGFMLGCVDKESDGSFLRIYSDGNGKLQLKSSAQDQILDIEYTTLSGQIKKLM